MCCVCTVYNVLTQFMCRSYICASSPSASPAPSAAGPRRSGAAAHPTTHLSTLAAFLSSRPPVESAATRSAPILTFMIARSRAAARAPLRSPSVPLAVSLRSPLSPHAPSPPPHLSSAASLNPPSHPRSTATPPLSPLPRPRPSGLLCAARSHSPLLSSV